MKDPWKTDVAVLLIFFARPDQLKKCFESVRKAKPRILLLWQDGPREDHPDDNANIQKCREIAERIDWDCTVYKNYQEKNLGCDPSTFFSHKWAFSIVDKCIILEDDLIASESFFVFCKEMLDKYENDQRIDRICGTNLLGQYDIQSDYFFSDIGNSWGWASWRRVAENWQQDYAFIDDDYAVNCMRAQQSNLATHMQWEKECRLHKSEGIPYWEHIIGAETLLNHRLVIYPKVNMICNIGISANSTHAPSDISSLPKQVQQYFGSPIYDLSWPLTPPAYCIPDTIFIQSVNKKIHGNALDRIKMYCERIPLKLKKAIRRMK